MRREIILFLIFCAIMMSSTIKAQVTIGSNASPTESIEVYGTARIRSLPPNGETNAISTMPGGTASPAKDQTFTATRTVVADANGVLGSVVGLPGVSGGLSTAYIPSSYFSSTAHTTLDLNSGAVPADKDLYIISGNNGTSGYGLTITLPKNRPANSDIGGNKTARKISFFIITPYGTSVPGSPSNYISVTFDDNSTNVKLQAMWIGSANGVEYRQSSGITSIRGLAKFRGRYLTFTDINGVWYYNHTEE